MDAYDAAQAIRAALARRSRFWIITVTHDGRVFISARSDEERWELARLLSLPRVCGQGVVVEPDRFAEFVARAEGRR